MNPAAEPRTVALVLPCYRPAPGWVDRLALRCTAFGKTFPGHTIVPVLVNDGTPGGIDPADVARLSDRLPGLLFLDDATNRGKGAALRRGMAAAPPSAAYPYTDVDLPYTTASMSAVAEAVLACGGVVAGERFDDYYASVPPLGRVLSRAHRLAMRKLFRLPVSDSQAGLKGFDESGRAVFLATTVDRFLVDLDFIARCRDRVPVRAVRVELRPDVEFTDFGLGILRREASNFVSILLRTWRPHD